MSGPRGTWPNVQSFVLESIKRNLEKPAIEVWQGDGQPDFIAYKDLLRWVYELTLQIRASTNCTSESGLDGKFIVTTVDDGAECVIVFLAIIFLNGTAVPVAKSDPRLNEIVAECNPVLCIDESFLKTHVNPATIKNCSDGGVRAERKTPPVETRLIFEVLETVATYSTARSLCYLIYTSGSTGSPKGVLVEHQNIIAFAKTKQQHQNIIEPLKNIRVFLCTSFTFDPYIGDVLFAVGAGGTICIAPKRFVNSDLHECLRATRATHIFATPTMWSTRDSSIHGPDTLPHLRFLALGGEQMTEELLKVWGNSRGGEQAPLKLVNTYGVTEATVVQTQCVCDTASERSFVGKPMAGNWIYILDPTTETIDGNPYTLEDLRRVPDGSVGEVVFAGDQVCRGYYRRPHLTRKKFFWLSLNNTKIRCFRTGDLGKLTASNGLYLLGRIDNQIKIRGHRVELGEIENACSKSRLVKECACYLGKRAQTSTANTTQRQYLILCVIPSIINTWSWAHKCALQAFLARALPPYMQPKEIHAIRDKSQLPRTTSMKIDRKALPSLATIDVGHHIIGAAPQSRAEIVVAKVWQQILGTSRISRYDNFFRLGGDSLGALRCVRIMWKGHIHGGGENVLHQQTSQYGDINSVLSPSLLINFPVLKDFAAAIHDAGISFIEYTDAVEENTSICQNSRKRKAHVVSSADSETMVAEQDQSMVALCEASRCGNLDVVEAFVIDEKIDPNCGVTRHYPGTTPLHVASTTDIVDVLYKNGAKLMLPTPAGILPIHNAAASNTKILRKLISLGVPLLAQDKNKQIAIHHAARAGNIESVQLLISLNTKMKKTFLDSLDRWNRTPLHWAILNRHVETVSILLEGGARVYPYNMSKIKHLSNMQGHRTRLPLELPTEMALRLYGKDSIYYTLLAQYTPSTPSGHSEPKKDKNVVSVN